MGATGQVKHTTFWEDFGDLDSQLLAAYTDLIKKLDRQEVEPEMVNFKIRKMLDQIDLEKMLSRWLSQDHPQGGVIVLRQLFPNRKAGFRLMITPGGFSHPPHQHHNYCSVQYLVRGQLAVREYERVRRIDENHLALRQLSDDLVKPGFCMLTSEFSRNVHWFSSIGGPTVIFNAAVDTIKGPTFDSSEKSKNLAPAAGLADSRNRGCVDPTLGQKTEDGLIIAKEISHLEGEMKFARVTLDKFPTKID